MGLDGTVTVGEDGIFSFDQTMRGGEEQKVVDSPRSGSKQNSHANTSRSDLVDRLPSTDAPWVIYSSKFTSQSSRFHKFWANFAFNRKKQLPCTSLSSRLSPGLQTVSVRNLLATAAGTTQTEHASDSVPPKNRIQPRTEQVKVERRKSVKFGDTSCSSLGTSGAFSSFGVTVDGCAVGCVTQELLKGIQTCMRLSIIDQNVIQQPEIGIVSNADFAYMQKVRALCALCALCWTQLGGLILRNLRVWLSPPTEGIEDRKPCSCINRNRVWCKLPCNFSNHFFL
jgi:hypothetical protein